MVMWHVDKVRQDKVIPPLGLLYFTVFIHDQDNTVDGDPRQVATSIAAEVTDPCQVLDQVSDYLESTDVDWTTFCA